MIKARVFLLTILLVAIALPYSVAASDYENGSFGSYLVGTVDLQKNNYTVIQIINPTARKLRIIAALFNHEGIRYACRMEQLKPNGMVDMVFKSTDQDMKPFREGVGIVKIVSYLDQGESTPEIEVTEGIVGFQRHYAVTGTFFKTPNITESNLASVPQQFLTEHRNEELNKITEGCTP